MRVLVRGILSMCLGVVAAALLGCGDDGGSGGGGVQIRPTNDGALTGFLWKPRSESNGRLVVLLPQNLTGNVVAANIHSTDSTSPDTMIAQGRFAGDTHNGNRAHFRFEENGAAYGANVWVIATTGDGQNLGWLIPNGAARWD
jgi:hypothetical protein